jgi:hypothetical protein
MSCRGFVAAIVLALAWFGSPGMSRAEEASRVVVPPTPRPSKERPIVSKKTARAGDSPARANPPRPSPAPEGKEAEPEQVLIQAQIVEIQGDTHRALNEAGFSESAAGHRYIPTEAGKDSRVMEILAEHAQVELISRPQIRTFMGVVASIQIGQEVPWIPSADGPFGAPKANGVPYLVRTGATTFELRHTVLPRLGIDVTMTPAGTDDPQQIEFSPLKISMTTLDCREPIPGLGLDVGKPITTTRTLETSIKLIDGAEFSGLALAGPPSRQIILFLRAYRIKPDPIETDSPPKVAPAPEAAPAAANPATIPTKATRR